MNNLPKGCIKQNNFIIIKKKTTMKSPDTFCQKKMQQKRCKEYMLKKDISE